MNFAQMSRTEWSELERRVAAFEAAWNQGRRPSIAEHLPDQPSLRAAVLVELIHSDFEFRLRAGEAVDPASYAAAFPELAEPEKLIRDLLNEARSVARRSPERHSSAERTVREDGGTDIDLADGVLPERLGRFELIECLGAGSFGVVHKARDPRLNRVVALKIPHPGTIGSRADRVRLRREATSAAVLRHPRIVAVHDVGSVDGVDYLVTEYIEGKTLGDLLADGPIEPGRLAELLAGTADALEVAHQAGIVHRDVKPSNILIDVAGRPYLADFGLARRIEGDASASVEGDLVGTPTYMSPEQARGDVGSIGPQSDVYSLGVVLYHGLAGRPPFGGSRATVLRMVVDEDPPRPRSLNPGAPRDLEGICRKAMEKDPARRYSSAGAMADDLRKYLRSEPVSARPLSGLERLDRWRRRKPAVAHLTFLVVALALAAFALVTWQWRRAERHLAEAQAARSQALERARLLAGLIRSSSDVALTLGESHAVQSVRAKIFLEQAPALRRLVAEYPENARDEPEYADACALLAFVEGLLNRRQEALEMGRTALEAWRRIVTRDPNQQPNFFAFLGPFTRRSARAGSLTEAREGLAEMSRVYESLRSQDANDVGLLDLAESYEITARETAARGDAEKAALLLEDVLRRIDARLAAAAAPNDHLLACQANALGHLSLYRTSQGKDARAVSERALEAARRLHQRRPEDLPTARIVVNTFACVRNVSIKNGGRREALRLSHEAARLARTLPGADADGGEATVVLITALTYQLRDSVKAKDSRTWDVYEELKRLVARVDPTKLASAEEGRVLGNASILLAGTAIHAERIDDVFAICDVADRHFARSIPLEPAGEKIVWAIARQRAFRAMALVDRGELSLAFAEWRSALDDWEFLRRVRPFRRDDAYHAGRAAREAGLALFRMGRASEARPYFEQALVDLAEAEKSPDHADECGKWIADVRKHLARGSGLSLPRISLPSFPGVPSR